MLEQFKNVLIIILLSATALSAFLGHGAEAIAITVIVLFAIVLGFVQEYRAERAIEALRERAAPAATVIRGGRERRVPARELVPGDLILLATGDKVPADVRLVEAFNLQTVEAALTSESAPVEKHTRPLEDAGLPTGDRKNMAYAGTAVTYGRGRAVVAATGVATEFGKIARMLEEVETVRTPLQDNLDRVGKSLARAALVVVAVETLGSTSVICSDKTGTLTRDEMTARRLFVGGRTLEVSGTGYEPRGAFSLDGSNVEPTGPLSLLLRAAVLASDARVERSEAGDKWEVKGDPTEGALVVVAAAKAGLDKAELDAQFPRISEIPFTSETKRTTTLHETPEGAAAYAKGAPEVIVQSCVSVRAAAGKNFRHLRAAAVGLGDYRRGGLHRLARPRSGEVDRASRVVRQTPVTRSVTCEESARSSGTNSGPTSLLR